MATKKKQDGPRVPRFKSSEEEAEFWDNHSPLDYPDYWIESTRPLRVSQPLGHILGVRLDANTIGRLGDIGRSKGLGASSLARMWLLERLEQEKEKSESGRINRVLQ